MNQGEISCQTQAHPLKIKSIPNQPTSFNTDQSDSTILISPNSPPLVEISPSETNFPPPSLPPPPCLQIPKNQNNEKKQYKNKNEISNSNSKVKLKSGNGKMKKKIINEGNKFPLYNLKGEKQCTNCSEIDTPQWRGSLCNACALWKRSRGTDRPLPLTFPCKRKSLSPSLSSLLSEEQDKDEIEDEDEINLKKKNRFIPDLNEIRRRSIKIDEREISPISRNETSRRFWVDRAVSEIPTNGLINNSIRNMSNIKGTLQVGSDLNMHGHARTMSLQHVNRQHHRISSSLSQSNSIIQNHAQNKQQPYPQLSIVPPSSNSNESTQIGRLNGIHSTPVSPNYQNQSSHNSKISKNKLLYDEGIKSRIANIMSSIHNSENIEQQSQQQQQEKQERRNSFSGNERINLKRSLSTPNEMRTKELEEEQEETGRIKSPYLPYSLDKRGKKSRFNNFYSKEYDENSINLKGFEFNQISRQQQTKIDHLKDIENNEDGGEETIIGISKNEFMKKSEWLFNILNSTSKLLNQVQIQDEKNQDFDSNVFSNQNFSKSYRDNQMELNQNEIDQSGLDILSQVAEDQSSKAIY
ncbi:uncharacterized protein I206_100234 [Kwoniella pini CBS 10737]|uniref:GATA-type domain-containing protein n=1 Tax=Kwoniella pini CBS 10737 TaxID=1296096 RepID=A0A1B9IEC5_9TREE|nr:uncharacterized protein I206_01091 [Kwoniella pini CBS 10737]OCF53784.1 hypothetical protein I206_01091 [Kwoniella pini CBS 10737]